MSQEESMMKGAGFFLFLVILFWAFWACQLCAQEFAGGTGIEIDPWQIANAEHLNNVGNFLGSTNSDKYFVQIADIDLGVAPWNQGEGWVPIGFSNYPSYESFYGHYDGNNHIITNLYINRPNVGLQGLFCSLRGSVVNLGLDAVAVIGSSDTGGLVGFCEQGTINNCYSTGNVTGSEYTGGLVGFCEQVNISNCHSMGNVTGTNKIGGLAGFNNWGSISNCYSICDVTGTNYAGGLIGRSDSGSISNSFSKGSVTGGTYIGGLVGYNYFDTISNCYSACAVSGSQNINGLVGTSYGMISNCYWDMQISGQTFSSGGLGRSTLEMTYPHASNTFLNWDWSIWKPDAGYTVNSGYPYLRPLGELPTQAPSPANNPVPADASTLVPGNIVLNWQVDSNQTAVAYPQGFRIFLGTDNPPTNMVNGIDLGGLQNYSPDQVLSLNTVYCWKIVPYNQIGEAIGCPVWSFSTFQSNGFAGGSGSEADPWQIANIEHLYNVRYFLGSSHADKFFVQITDINLGVVPWNQGEGWAPIGYDFTHGFYGHYNGSGHIIENLYINRTSVNDAQGLFGYLGGSVANLGIVAMDITGRYSTGGLVGLNGGTISNCYSTGAVTGSDYTGALVGYNGGTISNSYSTGSVAGTFYSGCLVGKNLQGTIFSCYSAGDVTGSEYTGGLAGACEQGSISNSYSTGNVTGMFKSGGLIGYNYWGVINNCYSTGCVSGSDYSGGLTGSDEGQIINCYWDIDTSGQSNSFGGEGRTTLEMTWPHAANTYVGWDFGTIWAEDPIEITNSGYPFVQSKIFQIPNPPCNPAPADLTAGVATGSALSWQIDYAPSGENIPTGYRLFLGTDYPPTNLINNEDLGGSMYYESSQPFAESTLYYWQVIPYNQLGNAENCPIWSFSTHTEPYAVLSASQVQFGNTWIGHSVSKTLTVRNLGAQNLELTLFISSGAFTVTTSDRILERAGQFGMRSEYSMPTREEINLTVAPMATETVYVHFLPTAQQQYLRNLFIETNASNLPSATIPLSGTGYVLFAEFQANPDIGDVPLEVSFVNQSVAGIIQSLWDFGDGGISEEINPNHYYSQEGVYDVTLTVWDDYYNNSVTHQVIVIAHPMLACDQSAGHVFNKTYVDEASAFFNVILHSSGTDTLYVSNVYWQSQQDTYFHHTLDQLNGAIVPGGSITIPVGFFPVMEGVFADTLCIVNNSENNPTMLIPFSGRGYTLHAGFSAEPISGDVPLTVAFTDTSIEDIIQWNWDFQDGGTSIEQHPEHVFGTEGVYPVSLTVSDGTHYSSINQQITVIAHAMLACSDTTAYNFGSEYLGDISESCTITVYSTGSDTLFINNIQWQNESHGLFYSCTDIGQPIPPGEHTDINVWFLPTLQGAFSDSLVIQTNAENFPALKVKFTGRGDYIPPKIPQNLWLLINGLDAVLTWDAVTENIYDQAIEPDFYVILSNSSGDPYSQYYFLGLSSDLTYTHRRVAEYQHNMFYQVLAFESYESEGRNLDSIDLVPGMTIDELQLLLSAKLGNP